jgi:hypothetical protein
MDAVTKDTPTVGDVGLDLRDREILAQRIRMLDRIAKPRVGDYVRFANGVERRISHDWDEGGIQTSDGGSFYLGRTGVSFSGSLYGCTPTEDLEDTGTTKLGSIWFFHHDWAKAHNGVQTQIPFRVYRTPNEAPN